MSFAREEGAALSPVLGDRTGIASHAAVSVPRKYFTISSPFWTDTPTWFIGTVVTLAHVAVFLTVTIAFHVSVDAYSDKGDGISYKHMAAAILGHRESLTEYDSRVFPGYPAMIAAVHLITRLPFGASALGVTYLAAGVAAALATTLFNDRRVGWAIALLMPHGWINMSLAMSEGPVLALMLAGILLARRERAIFAGLIFGLAGLTRPVACFALAGLLADQFVSRRKTRAILITAIAGIIVLAGMLSLRIITGGSLRGVEEYANSPRAYNGHLFAFPFQSIIWMTVHGNVSVSRWIYTIAHVLLALTGCAMLTRIGSDAKNVGSALRTIFARGKETVRSADPTQITHRFSTRDKQMRDDPLRILCLVWLSLNTLFVLCIGLGVGGWGFSHFPRFMIPALPPLAWSMRKFLPARPWMYIPIGAVLFVCAIYGVGICT